MRRRSNPEGPHWPGFTSKARIPSATVFPPSDTRANKGAIDKLFKKFNCYLHREGLIARQGQLIDASLVPAPRQRNTREENAQIKQGETPEGWKDQPHKLRQKDTDARWVKMQGHNHYGYKNYVNADRKHKLIRTCDVTEASVHDSQAFDWLLDPDNTGKPVWAYSVYRSEEIDRTLKKRGLKNEIKYKGCRHAPLSEAKRRVNKKRSGIRARVEHIFAFQKNSLGQVHPDQRHHTSQN